MKKIFCDLLDLLFPRFCPACQNRLGEYERHICLNCLSRIPKTNNHREVGNKLEEFFAGRIPFQRIASFAYFVQGGMMQSIIHELKYKNNPDIGIYIGELCGNDLKNSDFIHDIDYIVPVPLHPKRLKERGYNQSEKIAEGISFKTGLSLDSRTVIRVKNNPSQAKSDSREARWANVENIFTLTDKSKFEGKHILLVDDVLTTGSTLESCAKEILKTSNCTISILTIASAQ